MTTTTLPQRPAAPVRGQLANGPAGQWLLANTLQFQRDPKENHV